MATKRRRHAITETDDVVGCLAVARKRWPEDGDRPAALLHHLISAGSEAVLGEREERHRVEDDALAQAHAALVNAYPADYLVELREDWPA